jgi:hypothetical protein
LFVLLINFYQVVFFSIMQGKLLSVEQKNTTNMYVNNRSLLVRNLALATANGGITLVILLIAPLGLAAVIINTVLITISTFVTATAADRVIKYLQPAQPSRQEAFGAADEPEPANLSTRSNRRDLRR